jgi:hypothetical protein
MNPRITSKFVAQTVRSRQIKIIATTTPDRSPFHGYPCVLIYLRARSKSRVIESSAPSLRVALSGAEVRLLCIHFRRIYPRLKYKLAARTRHINRRHIPFGYGWSFDAIYTSPDGLVRIGWETIGNQRAVTRRPIIELFPKPYSRVRCLKWSWSWMPNSSEFKALAAIFGSPILSPHGDLEDKLNQLAKARVDLRAIYRRLHPHQAR